MYSVRLATGLRAVPACGGWFTGTASSAAVTSGPFTEDVRGNPGGRSRGRPLRQPASGVKYARAKTASKALGANDLPEIRLNPEEEGDAAESPT